MKDTSNYFIYDDHIDKCRATDLEEFWPARATIKVTTNIFGTQNRSMEEIQEYIEEKVLEAFKNGKKEIYIDLRNKS
jgi:23S rRNA G2445 N2-methylase RlmL